MPWSQIVIVPAPYWPFGNFSRELEVLERVVLGLTASRFSFGSCGIPFGTAHEASAPSCSRRRSQCSLRRVVLLDDEPVAGGLRLAALRFGGAGEVAL